MRNYKLHTLGICGSRWLGTGRIKTATGETVLFSGKEGYQHYEDVAIILKKGTESLKWIPINNRLTKIKLRGRMPNITMMSCYPPTNDSNEDKQKKDSIFNY